MGLNRIGKMRNGKPGCYFHAIVQTDVKANAWLVRQLLPIIPSNLTEWGLKFRAFVEKHGANLAVEGYQISK